MLVHDQPESHQNDGSRRWRAVAVAQSTVRSLQVVVSPPFFDDDLRLFQAVESFPFQQYVPEAGIEAFAEILTAK